jgi:hypothetical protein
MAAVITVLRPSLQLLDCGVARINRAMGTRLMLLPLLRLLVKAG